MRCLTAIMFLFCSGFIPVVVESQDIAMKEPGKPAPSKSSLKKHYNFENLRENRREVYPMWNFPEYHPANSAQNEEYLTTEEKQVYYYLNLVRMNPKLFAETYLYYLKNSTDYYESSLYRELQRIKQIGRAHV